MGYSHSCTFISWVTGFPALQYLFTGKDLLTRSLLYGFRLKVWHLG
jgi:hypothetical protein